MAVLIVLLLLAPAAPAVPAAWLGWRAVQARDHLTNAADLARQLAAQLRAADAGAVRRLAGALRREAAAARAATADPIWRASTVLPHLGDDLTAVRALAEAADDLADGVLAPLAGLDPARLMPVDARFDLAYLTGLAPLVRGADDALIGVRTRLDRVRTAGRTGQVAGAVATLRGELGALGRLTAALRGVAAALPAMLGHDRPRTYLLVCQNLAELRATGGIWSAFVVVRADRGALTMLGQGTGANLRGWAAGDAPPVPLEPGFVGLYGHLPTRYPADVNLTPHFPTAAALYAAMFRHRSGSTVDGVVATDPVALSYLLSATGPVRVGDQPALSATDAVRVLLSETYRRLDEDPGAQDAFFAATAREAFEAVLQRPLSGAAAISALVRAVTGNRILFWSADPAVQRDIEATPLSGALTDRVGAPTVGVFLNDGSGAKLGYYLRQSVTLSAGGCDAAGRRALHLRVALSSAAPRTGLPASVLGLRLAGDGYVARTLVSIVAPVGGGLSGASVDGAAAARTVGTERGRQVNIVNVEVPPGGQRVLEVLLRGAPGAAGLPALATTPMVAPGTVTVRPATGCTAASCPACPAPRAHR